MSNSVFVLWLENVDPELFSSVPSLQQLAAHGVDLHLDAPSLAERRACYYQLLTGLGAGNTGYFDAVKPVAYAAQSEDDTPDGVLGRLLPDRLRGRGLSATLIEECSPDALYALTQDARDCTIARLTADNDAHVIDDLVKRCMERLASGAHLVILTSVWHDPAPTFVNINNFLADIGLLEVGLPRARENINWAETLSYSLGSGQVWVNLRGREPVGSVMPGREHARVCEALQQELALWQDPHTGAPIVKQVLKKEDAYSGDYLFKAPDLVVEFRVGYAASPRATMLDFDPSAIQTIEGRDAAQARTHYARLIASGPTLVNGLHESARLVDVMPTIMYMLGQPAPGYCDGRVISTLFTLAHRQQYPRERLEDDEGFLTDEEEEQVEERLRTLGYLG